MSEYFPTIYIYINIHYLFTNYIAGLLFTEGNLQAITNENSYVAYEVENPALQESDLINITYTTDGYCVYMYRYICIWILDIGCW